jgi:hypothetical protein
LGWGRPQIQGRARALSWAVATWVVWAISPGSAKESPLENVFPMFISCRLMSEHAIRYGRPRTAIPRGTGRCRAVPGPLAKERRRHVHSRIDAAELPVRHETRRKGRPYTLVLTKDRALFDRERQATRCRDEADLAWLTGEWASDGVRTEQTHA